MGRRRSGVLKSRLYTNFLSNTRRARFKLAVRYCKQHADMLCADKIAESLASHNYCKFWKTVSRQNNSKATKFAEVVDGCSGDENIADRLKVHFSQLYNANVDDTASAKTKFHSSISSVLESTCFSDITVTIDDIVDACAKQKCVKL